ncbi:MAG: hypothetical protein KC457_12170 [Myxococcales bacterium]|nr:hypothetical protein [Myxococcales bacterium]
MLAASLLAIRLAGAGWFLGPPAATSSEIEWQVPLACPDARWLDRRIEAYLGRPLSVADRALVRARRLGGRVEAHGAGYALTVQLDGGEPQRLEGHDCRALSEVAASLLAISIDPLALGEPTIPAAQSEDGHWATLASVPIQRPTRTRAAPRPSPPPKARNPPEDPPKPTPTPSWELVPVAVDQSPVRDERPRTERPRSEAQTVFGLVQIDGGLALGVLPQVGGRIHGGAGIDVHGARLLGLRLLLEGGATLGGRFRADGDPTLGGNLWAWDLGLRPCLVPRWGRVDLRACAVVGGGLMRGVGVGVQAPQVQTQPWAWLGLSLGTAVALRRPEDPDGRLRRLVPALTLDLDAGVNALRPRFDVLDAMGETAAGFVMPIAWLRGGLGLELRFF